MKDKKKAFRHGPEIPGCVRVDEAAARIGVAENTLYTWIKEGLIPHVAVGRRMIRIREEVVAAQIRDVQATGVSTK